MISEIIKLNQEVDNFVKAQKNVLSSYASENVLTNQEKILKQQIDKKGYHYVRLYNENGWKYFKVHRLVAEAFIENINNEPTIDHIDRNKDNNCIDNLRWASNILQANNKDKTNIIENMRKLGKSGKGLKARWN